MKKIILIILFPFILNAQSDLIMLLGGGVTVDTISTTLTIDKDFELVTILEDDFTSDITGWNGLSSTAFYYDTDWNSVGKTGALLDSATATSSARFYTNTAVTAANTYKLSYDYYIPSSNTTTAGIFARYSGTPTLTLTEQTTLDSWTSANEVFNPTINYTLTLFYQTNGAGSAIVSVGDKVYIDNFSLASFPSFTATGNHTFDSTSASPITGSYSGKITATGAGDGTTNYATLPTADYTTLKAGHNAYISFNALASTTGVNVTMVIGGKSKTWTGVDNSSAETLTWEFKVSSAEVGQDILIYLNKAANIKIDDFGG